jgi:hypothetical protein
MADIFRIWDDSDSSYNEWFGTVKDIKAYLEDQAGVNANYDPKASWQKNLEGYGLSYAIVRRRVVKK